MESEPKLDFTKDYILENDFVKLMPLNKEHILPLLEVSKDPVIWKYFFDKGDTYKDLAIYIDNAIENRKLGNEYAFVVLDKIKNKIAGTTRFYEYSNFLNTIKLGHSWYGKQFRGSGLNKHCKYLLFQFVFEKLVLERIGFGAYIDNVISIAALKSVGCKKEGVLRNMFPAIDKEGRTDAILMSILKDDWLTNVKSELNIKISV